MRRRRRPSAAGRRSPPFPYPPRRLPRSNASWPRRFRDPPRANRRVRRALGRSRRRPTAPLPPLVVPARILFFSSDSAKRRQLPQRAPAREFWFRLGARGTAHDAALPTNVRASATFPGTTDGTFRAARVRLPRLFSGSAVSPASALAAAVASEHLEKLADQKHLLKRCRASPRCRG